MNMMDINFEDDFMDVFYGKKETGQMEQSDELMENGQDAYGYPFEPIDTYSTEPLEFIETARMLEAEAEEAFRLIRLLNRQSPMFLKISAQFEKMLNRLGIICITKAVIEQRKENTFEFDGYLRGITINWLRGMAALNFRKCFDAFMEGRESSYYNQNAFALSIRWAALDKRLQATAEKIELIKTGKIKIDCKAGSAGNADLSGDADSSGSDMNRELSSEKAASLTSKARALPVDKTVIRTLEQGSAGPGSETEETAKPEDRSEIRAGEPSEAPYDEDFSEDHDDEETLPIVSEDPVRRESEQIHSQELIEWPFPQPVFAKFPP